MSPELKHLFVEEGKLPSSPTSLILQKREYYHYLVNVLRFKPDDNILLLDGKYQARCRLSTINSRKKEIALKVDELHPLPPPPLEIALYAGLPKADTAELIINQATQLGVTEIHFFHSAFTEVKTSDISPNKRRRWHKIAREAAQQSRRFHLPTLSLSGNFQDVISRLSDETINILFYEGAREYTYLCPLDHQKKVNIFIGAEGGFSCQEVDLFSRTGGVISRLSEWRLRTATACTAAVALISSLFLSHH